MLDFSILVCEIRELGQMTWVFVLCFVFGVSYSKCCNFLSSGVVEQRNLQVCYEVLHAVSKYTGVCITMTDEF